MKYLYGLLILFAPLTTQAAEIQNLSQPTTVIAEQNAASVQNSEQTEAQNPANVFKLPFMNALRVCQPAEDTTSDNATAKILGIENKKCHLQYADFDLHLPLDVLPNIHSFDDLQILLRNPDFAHYNFQPQYTYNGLLHALNACAQKYDYLGAENEKIHDNKRIKQGLEAEFSNDICTIYLISELEVEGVRQDYTVTCRIDTATIAGLLNYYRELLEKYGEKHFTAQGKMHVRSAVENEQTRKADAELMFFLQQKDYCN